MAIAYCLSRFVLATCHEILVRAGFSEQVYSLCSGRRNISQFNSLNMLAYVLYLSVTELYELAFAIAANFMDLI